MAESLQLTDQPARGPVGGAAALRLRRLARAAHAADHGPDGRRRAARGARIVRPGDRAVGRAAADTSSTGSSRCSPTCSRSPGSTPGRRRSTRRTVDLRDTRRRASSTPCARWPSDAGTEIALHRARSGHGVSSDPRRVDRILRNLLVNAIEHGEGEPIDCPVGAGRRGGRLRPRPRRPACGPVSRRWCSTGSGGPIPARARTLGGTGLGLPIALEDARTCTVGGWQAWGEPGDGAQLPAHPAAPTRAARDRPAPLPL